MIKIAFKSLRDTIFRLDTQYILHGGFWLTVSQSISIASVIGIAYIFANYVAVADYGQYKYILSLGTIFGAFALTGMAQSVTQASARGYTEFVHTGFRYSTVYGLSVSVIATIAALYYFLNENTFIAIGCLFIAACVPFINAGQLIYAHLQGLQQFSLSAKLQILKIVITSAVIVGTIYLTDNILFYVAAYFVSNALTSVGIYTFTKIKTSVLDAEIDEHAYEKYISYARHNSVRDIITGIANEADKILAFQMLGATQLAIYAFAIAIPEQFKNIFKNLALLILVKFTGYDMEGIKKDMFKKVFLLGLILLLITIAYIIAAPFVYTFLFPKYTDSIMLSQIAALSFLSIVAIFPVSALQSQMMERDLHALNIGTAVILLLSMLAGIHFFGLVGLILSRVFVRYVSCILAFVLVYKK